MRAGLLPCYLARHILFPNRSKIMELKITGTITRVLEEVTGAGRNGPWRKQEYVLETEGNYPKQVCLAVWGDNVDQFGIREGERITASIDIQSREYNGRWYTDVKAWKVEREGTPEETSPGRDAAHRGPADADEDDDLPF